MLDILLCLPQEEKKILSKKNTAETTALMNLFKTDHAKKSQNKTTKKTRCVNFWQIEKRTFSGRFSKTWPPSPTPMSNFFNLRAGNNVMTEKWNWFDWRINKHYHYKFAQKQKKKYTNIKSCHQCLQTQSNILLGEICFQTMHYLLLKSGQFFEILEKKKRFFLCTMVQFSKKGHLVRWTKIDQLVALCFINILPY